MSCTARASWPNSAAPRSASSACSAISSPAPNMPTEHGVTSRLRFLLFRDAGVLPLLFAALVIALALTQPHFLATQNIVNVLRSSAFLIIAASGQMLVLVVGGIDLSIGAVIALTSVVSSSVMAGLPTYGVHDTAAIVALGVLAGL